MQNHKIPAPGLGNVNPKLYLLAQNAPDVFHDITQGNNIVPCQTGTTGCTTGSIGFTAGPGYDMVTELGSVDAVNLVNEWSNYSTTGTSLHLSASQNPLVNGIRDELYADRDGDGVLRRNHAHGQCCLLPDLA